MSDWSYSNYSKVLPEVQYYFPFDSARKEQLETISEIAEAINKGYKYIVLEAGTGTGKSAIAATLARMYESAYILTITKQLQHQYLDDFEHLGFKLVKGRNNFTCRSSIMGESCENGQCITNALKCPYKVSRFNFSEKEEENSCYYGFQKVVGLYADVVITNYTYAYLDLNFDGDGFGPRELMICDEAHNLEKQLMKELTLEFERKEFKDEYEMDLISAYEGLSNKSKDEWCDFLEKLIEKDKLKETLFRNMYNDTENPAYKVKMAEYARKIERYLMFKEYISSDDENWVIDRDIKQTFRMFFKPITINNYTKSTLFRFAKHCIFMSATILDYKAFAKHLGIKPNEIYAIRRKTPFDSRKNPILTYDINMKHEFIKTSARRAIPVINNILNMHKGEKGLIHTHTNKCARFIMDAIDSDRLISHLDDDRQKVLNIFENSKDPLVLVSPSMDEGVDLPGDKCKFQIIFKIPYLPYVSDKQVDERRKIDKSWYFYRTVIKLIQTYGRGMRSEDDDCVTYVLDNRIKTLVEKNRNLFPESFLKALGDKRGYSGGIYKGLLPTAKTHKIFSEPKPSELKAKSEKMNLKKIQDARKYSKSTLNVSNKQREQAKTIPIEGDIKLTLWQLDSLIDNQKAVSKAGLSKEIESKIKEDLTVLIKLGIVKRNTVKSAVDVMIDSHI